MGILRSRCVLWKDPVVVSANNLKAEISTYDQAVAVLGAKYQELLAKATDENEKKKLSAGIHHWVVDFSTIDTKYTGSDSENSMSSSLWTDLEKNK